MLDKNKKLKSHGNLTQRGKSVAFEDEDEDDSIKKKM